MAPIILILALVLGGLDIFAMRRLGRASLRNAQDATPTPPSSLDELVARTGAEIALLLDLQRCWFEPFPFDMLMPRIEEGRIVLPTPEPGLAPCSEFGVELPVRLNGLTLGRFVLLPGNPTVGVGFPPTARDRAIALAGELAAPLAFALTADSSERS